MKTLIVYHSRTGYTRRVAESLARRLHADLDQIVTDSRDGPLGYVRCALEALGGLRADIRTPRHDPSAYSLVVIGTPVWFWRLSSPVRTYLTARQRRLPRVAFFCTMGGSGARGVFDTMAAVSGRQPVATLALTDRDIDRHHHRRIDTFVHALQRPAAARSGPRTAPRRPAAKQATA